MLHKQQQTALVLSQK